MITFTVVMVLVFAYGYVLGKGAGWKKGWEDHKKLEDKVRPHTEARIQLEQTLRSIERKQGRR